MTRFNPLTKGHDVMTAQQAPSTTLYPDPDGGAASSPVRFNASATAGDSPFSAAGQACVIHSLHLHSTNNGDSLRIEDHAGNLVFLAFCPGSNIPSVYNFGPEGIYIEDGFRIVTPANTQNVNYVLSYEPTNERS